MNSKCQLCDGVALTVAWYVSESDHRVMPIRTVPRDRCRQTEGTRPHCQSPRKDLVLGDKTR
jgi:hypothetical protein